MWHNHLSSYVHRVGGFNVRFEGSGVYLKRHHLHHLSGSTAVIAANNGGFWPQGVVFIVLVALALWLSWYLTTRITRRQHRRFAKRITVFVGMMAFCVLILAIIAVVAGTLDPPDPNQEQRDRLGLTDE